VVLEHLEQQLPAPPVKFAFDVAVSIAAAAWPSSQPTMPSNAERDSLKSSLSPLASRRSGRERHHFRGAEPV
jgi:hypothetical protein